MEQSKIDAAARAIESAKYAIAFTGAGISAESGIPTFRGSEGSVWQQYDPALLEYEVYRRRPKQSWPCVRDVFYKYVSDPAVKPNAAHLYLAELERRGMLQCVVTQNVDDLHQRAGSKNVFAFHGSVDTFECLDCGRTRPMHEVDLTSNPPTCPTCNGLLKPGFVFFGEGIPEKAYSGSFDAARRADVVIVVGTTGEVMPACMVPIEAKRNGAIIIEINPKHSALTARYTDIYIEAGAVEAFTAIAAAMR